MKTSRIRHYPAPRICFGAQTAYVDSDWLKRLKLFTAGRFVLVETKQFCFNFISVSFLLCGQHHVQFDAYDIVVNSRADDVASVVSCDSLQKRRSLHLRR